MTNFLFYGIYRREYSTPFDLLYQSRSFGSFNWADTSVYSEPIISCCWVDFLPYSLLLNISISHGIFRIFTRLFFLLFTVTIAVINNLSINEFGAFSLKIVLVILPLSFQFILWHLTSCRQFANYETSRARSQPCNGIWIGPIVTFHVLKSTALNQQIGPLPTDIPIIVGSAAAIATPPSEPIGTSLAFVVLDCMS